MDSNVRQHPNTTAPFQVSPKCAFVDCVRSVCVNCSPIWAVLRGIHTEILHHIFAPFTIIHPGTLDHCIYYWTLQKCSVRVTQRQHEAAKADSCQQAAPKRYASALVSRKLPPLCCGPLVVFASHGKQLEKAQKPAEV